MNDLERYFRQNDKRLIHKWNHYFDIYDRYLNRYRGKEIILLEIGVSHGGSLQMWRDYFGENAKIYGIDIEPRCKELEEDNIEILIGSQSDREFLREVKSLIPMVDILIDDGGHTMKQQVVTYEELFDHVKENGVYICEDLHTSYWLAWGGGYKRRNTFIEFSKNFIDYINAFHSEQNRLKANSFTKSVDSLHYHDSILVIEKNIRQKPYQEKTGNPYFSAESRDWTFIQKVYIVLVRIFFSLINRILRFFNLPGFSWEK
jgi:cephalosporin hydroxylase